MTPRSALYRGTLVHTRRDHLARRTFRYPVYLAALDLDELPALDRELRLFSHRRRNLFSFHETDYEDGTELVASLARLRDQHALPPPAATRLVTNLRVAGYVFNPVSFFIDYDRAGAITSVIAEVNNTYGGRVRYVLGPSRRIPGDRVGFRHPRELFVSPFLHGPRDYELWFAAPLDGDRLAITMHVDTPGGERIFTAALSGTRHPLTDRALLAAAIRYPFMTAQVIGLIHLEAMRLRLAGGRERRPGPDQRPLDE